MQKEVISNKQGTATITMFILGSTLVLGAGAEARQDVWLAILFAVIFTIPVLIIYARSLYLFPGKNLYEIADTVFGKFAGRVIALFFTWYSFHLGTLVLRNFQEFIKVVSFPETPEFVSVMLLGILCIWVVKEGIEVLGRWSQLIVIFVLTIVITVTILSMTKANIDNLRPFLYNGLSPVLKSAFIVFSFPFAETVLFITVFSYEKGRNSPYKIYFSALAVGGFIVMMMSVRNMLILGFEFIQRLYFPSYTAISLINIGEFLQRIEIFVAVMFLANGFVKISICLLSASKGVDYLFKLGNYRQIVAPVGLMMMVVACFIYQSTMEMTAWISIYKYYAFPFQVILPVIIWIAAEIKAKKLKKSST